jgi:hypothetical protein
MAAIFYCGTSLRFPKDGRYPERGRESEWHPDLIEHTIEQVRARLQEVEDHPKFKSSGPDPVMAICDFIANRMLLPETNPMRSLFTSVVFGDSGLLKWSKKGSSSLEPGLKAMTGGWGSIFIETEKGAKLRDIVEGIRRWKRDHKELRDDSLDISRNGKFPRQIVLHVFANLNDCMCPKTWKAVTPIQETDMLDLVQEMCDFVHPIFVITAEARRWGITDAKEVAFFNNERARIAKFVAGHDVIVLQGSTFYDAWWHLTSSTDRWHAVTTK